MRARGWRWWLRYQLERWRVRLVIYALGVRERWDDWVFWWRSLGGPAGVGASDYQGCFSNGTHRERLDVYVTPATPRKMAEAYLRQLGPRRLSLPVVDG